MKNINYKYVSLVLGFVLVVTYAWHWNDIFFHKNNDMDMGMNMNSMHKMPDGSMMNMSDMQSKSMQKDMGMDNMMMDMLAGMKGKTGKELEKVFLQEMIVHHQGAVDMARELLKDKTVTNPELIKFANDIITNQSREIEMQKAWLKNY